MGQKKTFDFSEKDLKELKELSAMLYGGLWGEEAKTLKFSITFTKKSIEQLIKVIPDIEPDKLETLLSTMGKIKKSQQAAQNDANIQQNA